MKLSLWQLENGLMIVLMNYLLLTFSQTHPDSCTIADSNCLLILFNWQTCEKCLAWHVLTCNLLYHLVGFNHAKSISVLCSWLRCFQSPHLISLLIFCSPLNVEHPIAPFDVHFSLAGLQQSSFDWTTVLAHYVIITPQFARIYSVEDETELFLLVKWFAVWRVMSYQYAALSLALLQS